MSTQKVEDWNIYEEINKKLKADPFKRKFEKVTSKGKTTIIGFPEPVDTEPWFVQELERTSQVVLLKILRKME